MLVGQTTLRRPVLPAVGSSRLQRHLRLRGWTRPYVEPQVLAQVESITWHALQAAPVDLKSLESAGFRSGAPGEAPGKGDEAREAADEQRRMLLTSVLTPEARERLNRVSLVKPDNARAVEDHIIRLARSGKITTAITEDGLIRFLEEVTKAEAAVKGVARKVTITRKKRADSDDDDDDDF